MNENAIRLAKELATYVVDTEACECEEEENQWCIFEVAQQLWAEIENA